MYCCYLHNHSPPKNEMHTHPLTTTVIHFLLYRWGSQKKKRQWRIVTSKTESSLSAVSIILNDLTVFPLKSSLLCLFLTRAPNASYDSNFLSPFKYFNHGLPNLNERFVWSPQERYNWNITKEGKRQSIRYYCYLHNHSPPKNEMYTHPTAFKEVIHFETKDFYYLILIPHSFCISAKWTQQYFNCTHSTRLICHSHEVRVI